MHPAGIHPKHTGFMERVDKSWPNRAGQNDFRFATQTGETNEVVMSPCPDSGEVAYLNCYKPLCGGDRQCKEYLRYPAHSEFRRRIPYSTWNLINADLNKEVYRISPSCMVSRAVCIPLGPIGLYYFEWIEQSSLKYKFLSSLHKIIAYYNKKLFHPMLIDAQLFAKEAVYEYPFGNGSALKWYTYYIGFIIAPDAETFRTYPRPQVGISSGYKVNMDTKHDWYCCASIEYHLNNELVVPKRLPPAPIVPESMYVHSPEYLARTPQLMFAPKCCGLCPCCCCDDDTAEAIYFVKPQNTDSPPYELGPLVAYPDLPQPVSAMQQMPSGDYAATGHMQPLADAGYQQQPVPVAVQSTLQASYYQQQPAVQLMPIPTAKTGTAPPAAPAPGVYAQVMTGRGDM